ncbi:GIY-YIG nuclease family protein [Undibacterium arcticum]|uniref:GIY-YIG nuclease family protein n=1 Tax=Undibacterium arcticum TaxID=1762892 RepID=UPI00360A4ABA
MKTYYGVCGLYEIRNLVGGIRYIGSSEDLGKRLGAHRNQLRKGIHGNRLLQGAWNKYGEAAFAFRVAALLVEADQFPTEGRWIKACLADGELLYNLADDVLAPGKGYKHTPETRALRRLITIARFADPNERKKVSDSAKRTLADPEIRAKRSAQRRAENADPAMRKKRSDGMKAYYANTPGAREKTAAAVRKTRQRMKLNQVENPPSTAPEPPLVVPAIPLESPLKMRDIPYLLIVNGDTKTLTEWAKGVGITTHAIVFRLQNGWTPERAVSEVAPERPNAKLTLEQATQIRAQYPAKSYAELASQFGVDKDGPEYHPWPHLPRRRLCADESRLGELRRAVNHQVHQSPDHRQRRNQDTDGLGRRLGYLPEYHSGEAKEWMDAGSSGKRQTSAAPQSEIDARGCCKNPRILSGDPKHETRRHVRREQEKHSEYPARQNI